MPEHVTDWLGAYHDGELRGGTLRHVEQHLAGCAACRAELEELRQLSGLLHMPAPQADLLPNGRFVANLTLRLPPQPEPPQPRHLLTLSWWLIPLGVLGAWLLVEITLSLSALVGLAVDTGLLGEASAWLQGSPLQMEWFAAVLELFGDQLSAPSLQVLSALHEASLFFTGITRSLLPQALLSVVYLGWLFVWWLRQGPAQTIK